MFSLKIVKGQELAAGATTEMRLPAPPARLAIGRDPQLDWPLPDRTLALSARHCEIVVGTGGALLRDLSTNGTFVNGATTRMAHDHPLAPGDQFEVGPYRIAVSVAAGAPPASAGGAVDLLITTGKAAPAPEAAPPARVRGGDPAAAPAGGGARAAAAPPAAPASARPADDAPVTRIRPPPKAGAEAPAPRAPAEAARAPAAAAPASDTMLAALAAGLGVDSALFAQHDPAEVARRLALLARTAVSGLRRLLEQETRARRRLGSRQGTLSPIRDANPLRLARTPEDALVRLLLAKDDGAATLRAACDELAGHHDQLMAAFAGAARRLAEQIDPAALEAALAPTGRTLDQDGRKAQLWDLYASVWHRLGLAPDESWSRGFIDAAMLHVASAYDEGGDDANDGARGGSP